MEQGKRLGFLTLCADRRFHKKAEEKFQELTGLEPEEYWIEAAAGGTPGIETAKTADYAYGHGGARLMGWAAHGDNCGGFPGVTTEEMEEKLLKAIEKRKKQYPQARHFRIFSTEQGTKGEEI